MTPITRKQIQLIKIAQRSLCIDDETYREMLRGRFGVDSCTKLSALQAAALIRDFTRQGFDRGGRKGARRPKKAAARAAGNVVRLASAEEMAKIDALSGLIAWKFDDGFSRWMQRRFAIRRVRTAMDAWRVIEGLKAMFERKMTSRYGAKWWKPAGGKAAEFSPDVQRYIQEHKGEDHGA